MEHLSGIDNVRNYPPEMVRELEQLLLAGASASPDPRRKYFYDLENHERAFFIYISPLTGQIVLLATWLRQQRTVDLAESAEAAMNCGA